MSTIERRYDIDWLRVIAIGLLLIYHVSIGFQPWGFFIGFITNKQSLDKLWMAMQMLNVWRIPFLFFVSGMGVYFALRNRSWQQLLLERTKRILIPFLFGMIVIVPLQIFLIQTYYNQGLSYVADPSHLWFLGNIFVYVLLLLPFFYYVKKNETAAPVVFIKKLFGTVWGLLLVFIVMIIEVVCVDPTPYELYAMKWHGFFLGLAAFIFGFCFVLSGKPFWNMLLKGRWIFLIAAAGLYIYRMIQAPARVAGFQLSIESTFWILTVFAFGYRYLNRPSKVLGYLSEAAYPVYIVHMIFLYLASMLLFPLEMPAALKYVLALLVTLTGSMGFYELVIKRIGVLRFFFGLSAKKA
ncbi:acyltransferase family protein [Gynurincola endophyticus]|uniref:acyltransferase family protein n=1 Tax=Gynurincola endophyticus TaxID=2479004 RepID=UPI000F8C597E|nr:acyltransferase family protein [Gynurincola endophyticus]